MKLVVTEALQGTVRVSPWIKEVYVDVQGLVRLHAYSLPAEKDAQEKSLYAEGDISHWQVMPGINPDNLKEPVLIGRPGTEIVETVSREQILSVKVERLATDPERQANEIAELKALIAELTASKKNK
jgi:hypothetical protein